MFENLNASEFERAVASDDKAVLLDVRTKDEVMEGKIPGAIHMDIFNPDFTTQAMDLDKSKKYYVYCRSGGRSANACQVLIQLGFDKPVNLSGGIMSWQGDLER